MTQVYDSGACIYFYFGFNYRGLNGDPVEVYERIEVILAFTSIAQAAYACVLQIAARNEILACGGSISHHHGVGKLRKHWVTSTVGEVGVSLLRAMKKELDPTNVLANHNLIDLDNRSKL